jgi:uncharacterized protein YmfQ (DUF2313 family)
VPDETLIARYRDSTLRHLPPGIGITRTEGRNIPSLLEALAVEPARVAERVIDMLAEAFPGTTVELIDEWEEALGLPDDCVAPTVYADRIAAIVARFVGTSGHSEADYIELAESLGYEGALVVFTRNVAFKSGRSKAGDKLWNNHQWTATVTVGGSGDVVRDALLECAFNARRRAHTEFIFVFNDVLITIGGDMLTIGGEGVWLGA